MSESKTNTASKKNALSDAEVKYIKEKFVTADADKSGNLDISELIAAIAKFGYVLDKEEAEGIKKASDKNNDGRLDLEELVNAISKLVFEPKEDDEEKKSVQAAAAKDEANKNKLSKAEIDLLANKFKQGDKNDDKALSQTEFSYVLATFGVVLTKDELKDLFKAADVNDDGKIQWKELLKAVESLVFHTPIQRPRDDDSKSDN